MIIVVAVFEIWYGMVVVRTAFWLSSQNVIKRHERKTDDRGHFTFVGVHTSSPKM
jgi:hypothetical protein